MPILQHFKWFLKRFFLGANYDTELEGQGSSDAGTYVDSSNSRPRSMHGQDGGSIDKINGEELKCPNVDNACVTNTGAPLSQTYKCIGDAHFFLEDDKQDHTIEFWADTQGLQPSLIRIDCKIVLRSDEFPITTGFPLQLDVNNSCIGGEIYITDFNVPPMFFNLKDLMVNGNMIADENGDFQCTEKYFGNFDIKQQLLSLDLPLDHPVFVQLSSGSPFGIGNGVDKFVFGGAGGLIAGQYQYQIRYVSATGDRTAFSVATPLIPVVANLDASSTQYPHVKTFGKEISIVPTAYGIHFRFRVVNTLNYDFVEIKRIRYNLGAAIGTAGIEELLSLNVDISNGDIKVIDCFDNGDAGLPFDEDAGEEAISVIEKAKAIRYYNNRLFLMNIKYASRDLQGKIDFLSPGSEMFPVIQKLFKAGHDEPYNHTYYRSYMRGEKYGWAIVFFDRKGQKSFAVPIPNFDNFQMPNRREEVTVGSNTETFSQDGVVKAANTTNTVSKTHEVFDLADSIQKTDKCSFKNIVDEPADACLNPAGGKVHNKVDDAFYGQDTCGFDSTVQINDCGGLVPDRIYPFYLPYHPISQTDASVAGHDYRVDLKVNDGSSWFDYNPKGFAPNYFSLGMALAGVDRTTLPDWVQSFAVVRSRPADRIVCQGLGFYSLIEADFNFIGNSGLVGKNPDELWFFSPDIAAGIVDAATITDIQNSPQNYEIELVSPLGLFSEVYSFDQQTAGRDRKLDMATYVRMLREDGSINIGDNATNVGINGLEGFGYVGYDKWRNVTSIPNPTATGNIVKQFAAVGGFSLVSEDAGNPGGVRSEYYKIKTTTGIYNTQYTGGAPFLGGAREFNDVQLKNWHEPMYIVNIIRKNVDVPSQNINDFLETGHYQKLDATIGQRDNITNPNKETFLLVDERREDCIPDVGNTVQDKVLFIEKNGEPKEGYWLNITNKTAIQRTAILNGIVAGTQTAVFNGNTVSIKGVYTHTTNVISATQSEYTIVFDKTTNPNTTLYNDDLFLPPHEALIIVKYDMSQPLKVFGGDVTIGESVFAPLDRESVNGGSVGNEFGFGAGFPYYTYDINPRAYIAKKVTPGSISGERVQDINEADLDYIRQMIAMFTVESRINMPFAFNDEAGGVALSHDRYFPLVHYIMRPHEWDAGSPSSLIWDAYFTDYPSEDTIWTYGGFRFLPQTNIDYSHSAITQQHFTKPQTGFKEETHFCSRVIWSEIRPVNLIDAPGVRTFPVLNIFDISDDSGEIKFAWDDMTDKRGSNLYAITEGGICLLMTDKRTVTELTGGQLAVVGATGANVVQEQIWLTKSVGMNDEMWRSAAEFDNTLYFTNLNSAYKLAGAQWEDILRNANYHSRIYGDFLQTLRSGYQDDVSAVYDLLHNEYWIHLAKRRRTFVFEDRVILEGIEKDEVIEVFSQSAEPVVVLPEVFTEGDSFYMKAQDNSSTMQVRKFTGGTVTTLPKLITIKVTRGAGGTWTPAVTAENTIIEKQCTFAYGEQNKHWYGCYDYSFDKFVSYKNRMFGVRKMEKYELNKGFFINGKEIENWVLQAASPEQINGKEFIRIRVASDVKPTKIEFFDNMAQFKAGTPQAIWTQRLIRWH